MDINAAFPSKYVKSSDIKGKPPVRLKISHVQMEDMGEGEEKAVLYFQGAKKGMVINATNRDILITDLGSETDNWTNHLVELCVERVNFKGKMVDGLRLRMVGTPAAVAEHPHAPLGGSHVVSTSAAHVGHVKDLGPDPLDDVIPF